MALVQQIAVIWAAAAFVLLAAALPLLAQSERPPTPEEAREFVRSHAPEEPPRRGEVPEGFMLRLSDPGCDPGQDCDDVGPWSAIRRAFIEQSGANLGGFGISWPETEPRPPVDGVHTYDFSMVQPDPWELKQKYVICHLHHFGGWMGELQFKDRETYNSYLEKWAEAACRFAREKFGVTIFECGGNERDLVAPETYRPHYPDWHHYYMDPVKAIHRGMKKAHPDNRLMIGQMCYTDRDHIGALYEAGAKGHFEILAIHAYGPRGAHVDMEQVIEAREGMDAMGDTHIPIVLTEGWSPFPLPDSIEKDPCWRGGSRPYTDAEIEHYRQSVLDGWRNLMTPRPGMYDPKWVIGAHYFVLNDHWGGRGWEKRGKAQYDESGNLKGYLLDGYFIGTSDPDYLKPLLRPWGLIDIEGKPKGDTIYAFPPYIPKHTFTAKLHADLEMVPYVQRQPDWKAPEVVADTPYRVTVTFTNHEKTAMTGCRFSLSEKSEKDAPGGYAFAFVQGRLHTHVQPSEEHLVRAKLTGEAPPETIEPGQTVTLEYEVTYDPALDTIVRGGMRKRIRAYCDLYYVWEGRPYHTDAWLPRVVVRKKE